MGCTWRLSGAWAGQLGKVWALLYHSQSWEWVLSGTFQCPPNRQNTCLRPWQDPGLPQDLAVDGPSPFTGSPGWQAARCLLRRADICRLLLKNTSWEEAGCLHRAYALCSGQAP